jgi:predicted alpha/beta-hydrolase family hydrolase
VTEQTLDIPTPRGPAQAHLDAAADPPAALVLGHGAGGGTDAPDIVAAAGAARAAGLRVARVEQPYRIAGRRSPAPAGQLDEAWTAVVTALAEGELGGLPLILGGRSAGARVACRTAADLGAMAVVCLAFPVHPPGKGDDPSKSRLGELDAVSVPVLVVQGSSDPFGMPPEAPGRTVVRISGNHSLRDAAAVSAAVAGWLDAISISRTRT